MKPFRTFALAVLALLSAGATQAGNTTVYRCGPDGRELSDRPCAASPGASETVRVSEPTAQEAARARAQAQREQRDADRAQRTRERFEAAAPSRPKSLGATQPPASEKPPRPSKPPKYLAPASTPSQSRP